MSEKRPSLERMCFPTKLKSTQRKTLRRCAVEESDHRHRQLLRARGEWQCGCSADKAGDEVASPHGRCPQAEDHILAHREAARSAGYVRFGSKADMTPADCDVRFTPESGHPSTQSKCPLWADTVAKVAAAPPDEQKRAIIESKRPPS
jgi:hypothetical protein